MKILKIIQVEHLTQKEVIEIQGGVLLSASAINSTPGISDGDNPFNKDWGWIGSGPGGQGINL
ncbi:hypothetical protein [Aquimarina sp. I32.4]|uniref:hypothetical protein n=1 Tax=Aquimarina sp. I32.4 TaxID=2053903 RepID=UPI000CDEEB2A|nr:hypothetical protein [Aquimarina sp. I32.4]